MTEPAHLAGPMVLVFERGLAHGFESVDDAASSLESIDIADGLYTAFTPGGEVLRLFPTEDVFGRIETTGRYDMPRLLGLISQSENCPVEMRQDTQALAHHLASLS